MYIYSYMQTCLYRREGARPSESHPSLLPALFPSEASVKIYYPSVVPSLNSHAQPTPPVSLQTFKVKHFTENWSYKQLCIAPCLFSSKGFQGKCSSATNKRRSWLAVFAHAAKSTWDLKLSSFSPLGFQPQVWMGSVNQRSLPCCPGRLGPF